MKKLILGAAMMIGFISFSNAQKVVAPAKETTKSAAKKVTLTKPVTPVAATPQPVIKKSAVTNPVAVKPTVKPAAATPATNPGVVLKKDGTPDKRYSSATTKVKGPLKKDGTPDKRFKTNKKE
ncbi:MAG: hypothetical protein ABI760_22010 [Ferruginibacter sp.]